VAMVRFEGRTMMSNLFLGTVIPYPWVKVHLFPPHRHGAPVLLPNTRIKFDSRA
jgi:hypothetical protein